MILVPGTVLTAFSYGIESEGGSTWEFELEKVGEGKGHVFGEGVWRQDYLHL